MCRYPARRTRTLSDKPGEGNGESVAVSMRGGLAGAAGWRIMGAVLMAIDKGRKAYVGLLAAVVLLACLGAAALRYLPKACDNRGQDVAEQPPSTEPASTETGLVALDLGLTVDAVTRATPGNPEGIKPPHLREEVQREPFMVPEGLENLALYKEVTSGIDEPNLGDLDQVTDGIKKSGDFDFVEMGEGAHWIQIDLAETRTLYAIAIWHFYKNATIYNDVIVRVADDKAFTENVRMLFNNDHDNSAGTGKGTDTAFYTRWWGELVDARGAGRKPTRARYVRVHTSEGMEGEWVRFVEVDVYGK